MSLRTYTETEERGVAMCEAVERLVESRRPEWEKIGEKRGEKRGEKIGEKRGEILGEKKKAETVAKKMLERGMRYDEIALISDLSIEEIKKIDAERK